MTTPNGEGVNHSDQPWSIAHWYAQGGDGSLNALTQRTQDNITEILKSSVKASPGWTAASEAVFDGLETALGLPLAIISAIVKRLFGIDLEFPSIQDALDAIEQVPILGDIVKAITGVVGGGLTELENWANETRDNITEFIDALQGIDLSAGPGAVLAAIGQAIADALEDVPVIGDIVQAITGIANGDLTDLSHFFDHLLDDVPILGDIVQAITGVIGGGLTDVSNFFNSLFNGLAGKPAADLSDIIARLQNLAPGSGLLALAGVPDLPAEKVTSGTLGKGIFPDLTRDMSSDLQGAIDAAINAIRNTPGTVGQAFGDIESTWASLPTALFNKLGGNNVGRASAAQAQAAMQTLANTISAQSAAINALQNLLEGANGYSKSVAFRQAETAVFDVAGPFTYTPPTWFNTATDSLDLIGIGGGSGGGGGLSDYSGSGGDSVFRVAGVDKLTGAGGPGVEPGWGANPLGASPGNQMYLDLLYQGGNGGAIKNDGTPPGAGGGGGDFFGVFGKGGTAGTWATTTLGPGQAVGALTGTVGAGGAGTANGFSPGDGGDGRIWARARAAMPSAFTFMAAATILPTYRLNTGVALTDAMTAAATWSRVPPGGAAGGHMLIIRAKSDFTAYVYLLVKTIGGVTNYELGRVVPGSRMVWRNGTIAEAIPFNAFSLTSDNSTTYTIGINGAGFDSYPDGAGSALSGSLYRSGGWASSDSALPGSITQFAFLDTGTPSRISSTSVATAQATSSTSYVDLATTGPSVTLTVPPSGEITVDISALLTTATNLNVVGYMGFVLSGVNTLAAADSRAASGRGQTAGIFGNLSRRVHLTGLTPGTTTVKAVYKSSAAQSTFTDRNIIVEPKP